MPYFDNNATTPMLPQARAAWLAADEGAWQNPSSPYRSAARAHRLLEDARTRLAALMRTVPERVVFNSGATEANNAIMAWTASVLPAGALARVSSIEHPSMLASARKHFGSRLRAITVARDGRVAPAELDEAMRAGRTGLVAVMAANNETGVLNPVGEIAAVCQAHGATFVCDASQWIGRLPARDLPALAFLVGCAHKFGGPKGVGFVCFPEGAEGFRGMLGGEHEHGHRAGTENLAAISAMMAALESGESHDAAARDERASWRDACAAAVLEAIPGACVHGAGKQRLWNTLSLGLPRHENTRWVARLDRLGFEVSTGSACATGSDAPSHVLAAMGVSAEQARRTIRISSGWTTTRADWRALGRAIAEVWRALESEAPGSAVIEI